MPVEPAKAPVRSAAPKKTTAQRSAEARQTADKITRARYEAVNGVFQLGSIFLVSRGMYADAGAVATHGPNISRELSALAEEDERIAGLVDYITSAGPYSALALAALPFIIQVAANHGKLDASKARMPGVVDPRELERSVKADIAHSQDQAAREIWEPARGEPARMS